MAIMRMCGWELYARLNLGRTPSIPWRTLHRDTDAYRDAGTHHKDDDQQWLILRLKEQIFQLQPDTIADLDGINVLDRVSILAEGWVSGVLNGGIKVYHIDKCQSLIVLRTNRVQGKASPLVLSLFFDICLMNMEHRKTEKPIGRTRTPSLLQIIPSPALFSISLLLPWIRLTRDAKQKPLEGFLACTIVSKIRQNMASIMKDLPEAQGRNFFAFWSSPEATSLRWTHLIPAITTYDVIRDLLVIPRFTHTGEDFAMVTFTAEHATGKSSHGTSAAGDGS